MMIKTKKLLVICLLFGSSLGRFNMCINFRSDEVTGIYLSHIVSSPALKYCIHVTIVHEELLIGAYGIFARRDLCHLGASHDKRGVQRIVLL